MMNVCEKPASPVRIKFDNGVVISGSYRYGANSALVVETYANDKTGLALHTRTYTYYGAAESGFDRLVENLNILKNELLACDINKFTGKEGMLIVKELLIGMDKLKRAKAA